METAGREGERHPNPPLERHREPSAMLRSNRDRTERRCTKATSPSKSRRGSMRRLGAVMCKLIRIIVGEPTPRTAQHGEKTRGKQSENALADVRGKRGCKRPAIPRDGLTREKLLRGNSVRTHRRCARLPTIIRTTRRGQ